VFLEIMKNIAKSSRLYFYRTKDGSEIDFVIDNLMRKFAIEVKYQRFSKATGVRNIVNFVKDEHIAESYLININLNSIFGKIKYLPAFLTSKIDFS
jgi:predicted AAA+ superfamily ATPase